MPRLDDENFKLKKVRKFERKSLRPWDKIENFIPLDNVDDFIENEPNKLANKQETNSKETVNKQETNSKETVNKVEIKIFPDQENCKESVIQSVNSFSGNSKETVNKVEIKSAFSSLVGLERSITIFIYKSSKISRSKTTEPITLEHVSNYAETSKKSAKTTIQHLINKNILRRINSKNGRGGWTQYELLSHVYNEILQYESVNKVEINSKESVNKVEAKVESKVKITAPSSSSDLINYKTTTTEMPEEWKLLVTDDLEKRGIPFRVSHVEQIYRDGKLTAEMLASSLVEFMYDYDNNHLPDFKKTSISFLMGIFLKGQPYVSEYYAEMMNVELKRLSTLAEQREGEQKALFEKAEEGRFYEWLDTQGEDFIRQSLTDTFTRDLYEKYRLSHPAVKVILKRLYQQGQEKEDLLLA